MLRAFLSSLFLASAKCGIDSLSLLSCECGTLLDFKSTLALEGALQLPSLLNNYIADSYQNQMPGLIQFQT
jgi:hypothetical protein